MAERPELSVDLGSLIAPLVRAVVAEAVQALGADGRLAYSEIEAAALLGVRPHVLRDLRLRGRVKAARLGKSYRYTRSALLTLLDGEKSE